MRLPARLILPLLVATAACATSGTRHTFVGPVTVVDAHVTCVGAAAASGQCFAQSRATRGLAVGECVEVSYVASSDATGPFHASRIKPVSNGAGGDCAGTAGR